MAQMHGLGRLAALVGLLGLLGLCGLSRAVGLEAPDDGASLIKRIAAAHRAIISVQGRATWRTRHRDEPAGDERVQLVRFFFVLPDQYHLAITKPGDEDSLDIVRSDGIRREELKYQFRDTAPDSTVTPVGTDDAEFTRLLACFRFDVPLLSKDFSVQAEAVADGARVSLRPLHAQLSDQMTSITIDLDAALAITRVVWDDPQGNRYAVTIDQAVYNQPIDPAKFHIPPPAPPPR